MVTHERQKITVIDMIKTVIVSGDTSKDISSKVINRFPEYLERKSTTGVHTTHPQSQIKAEITSNINKNEGKYFNINRTESTYTYSLIKEDEDMNDINFDDNRAIDITKTDRELDVSYIYIIDVHYLTPDGRKVVKIGKANDIEKRIHQIYSVELGVYKPTLLHSWKVQRPFKVEKGLHDILDLARLNPKRELFDAKYVEKKMSMIEMVIKDFIVD